MVFVLGVVDKFAFSTFFATKSNVFFHFERVWRTSFYMMTIDKRMKIRFIKQLCKRGEK